MRYFLNATKIITVLFVAALLSGCLKDKFTKTYALRMPVYKAKSDVLSDINSSSPQSLQFPGKIFISGNYLFVNEIDRGVHIFDIGNSSTIKPVAFVRIPGNLDIAVKGTTMYADMYDALLVLDITDPLNVDLVREIENVFPERQFGWFAENTANDEIIVDWIVRDTTVTLVRSSGWGMENCAGCFASTDRSAESAKAGSGGVPGIAGSMARFSVVNNHLYTLNWSSIVPFNINSPLDPDKKEQVVVGAAVETIYPFKNKLFIGSNTGMFIYNIDNPEVPVKEGSFAHVMSCDPVITDGTNAFVTLRTGQICTRGVNQLDVLDVRNVGDPRHITSYPFDNPHGLAKIDNTLFVCDYDAGLKVYDASSVRDLKLIQHIKNVNAYDVIAWSNKLLLVGSDGLRLYDNTFPGKLNLLSSVPLTRK